MTSIHSTAYKQFLVRLKKARVDARLTQREVAAALDLPQSFVSKSESGERRVDVVELAAFARHYKKPITYFVSS